jgi:ribosome-associated protein
MPRLQLDRGWWIPESDLELRAVRSPGPGGQNVNRVATKVELRFKLASSRALSSGQKQRLTQAFPAHVTASGDFVLTSNRFRSQLRNQQDALEKLARMIRSVRRPPRQRIPTSASAASARRRVAEKRQRGKLKRLRRGGDEE